MLPCRPLRRGVMAALGLSLLLAGCAGDPDATVLGVVMVPPRSVPAGYSPGVAQAKPAVVPASFTTPAAEPARRDTKKPDYLYDPDSPNKVVSRPVAPIAYAEQPRDTAPLKDSAEVNKTETELRRLAQRNAPASGRGLWNAKIEDLLNKRDHHIDDAIKKIEGTDAE